MNKIYSILYIITFHLTWGQTTETPAPFYIKTITLEQSGKVIFPFVALGEGFSIHFDDLYANDVNYYYTITHCNYDWTPSDLSRNEYLNGSDDQRLQNQQNSFNTLQPYTHYTLELPNKYCQITKSGNYIINLLNTNKEIVFSKKIIIYEPLVQVPIQVKRSRNNTNIQETQNIEFTISSKNILFQNPNQNLKILLLQNGKWNNQKINIKPQYTIGNDLIYKYNLETQFWAGNEYLYFDNKDLKVPSNNIARVDSSTGLYNTLLFTATPRKNKGYTYFPDANGRFEVRNIYSTNPHTESDYTWVYFSLNTPLQPLNEIYVTGLFNNYQTTPENKMEYNAKQNIYEKAILIKQGFTNFNFTLLNDKKQLDEANAIDGNYTATENNYTLFVYYRSNNDRYDRVIGKGETNAINIAN